MDEDDGSTELQGQGVTICDISDPTHPLTVTTYTGPPIAFPGPFYRDMTHIVVDDYLFTTKIHIGNPSAVHVFRFDRAAGTLELENIWT